MILGDYLVNELGGKEGSEGAVRVTEPQASAWMGGRTHLPREKGKLGKKGFQELGSRSQFKVDSRKWGDLDFYTLSVPITINVWSENNGKVDARTLYPKPFAL